MIYLKKMTPSASGAALPDLAGELDLDHFFCARQELGSPHPCRLGKS
jgi:hypothetical protein